MKKVISMIIAVSMLLSLCMTSAYAETSANPIINVYAEKYDGTNAPSYYKPGDYDVYKVSYTTEGVDTAEDMITALTIWFSIDDATKIANKSWLASKTGGAVAQRDANGFASVYPGVVPGEGNYSWASADGIDVYDWDTYPNGGTEETLTYAETLIYVTAGETVTFTYRSDVVSGNTTSLMVVDTYEKDNKRTFQTGEVQFKINGEAGNVLTLGAAPATVDVESVTISGATAATVGDNVQLSATVLPDNATDKTVTWEKVSGNGTVSDSGLVTATAAGDVVVKATAGGVASANYTVSFAAPAPAPVYTDSSIAVKKPVSGTPGLTDLNNNEVTLTANYGIAKFSKAIDTAANNYFVVATDSNDEDKTFEVDFAEKGVEINNASTTFFAIVKSPNHIIKNIRLKEVAK